MQRYTSDMSNPMPIADPVLGRFRQALDEAYGARVQRVVLFGSRARGDARSDSDYDVAVFLHGFASRDAEVDRLAVVQPRVMDETEAFVHAMPFAAGAWAERTPLMHEIRAEGHDL